MKKNSLIITLTSFIIILTTLTSNSQVLEGRIADGKGIIGIDLTIKKGSVPVVREIFFNTPAYYAGIQTGDKIIKIDNKSTLGLNKDEVDIAISDVPGDTINLDLVRNSKILHKSVKVVSVSTVDSNLQQLYLNEE